MALPYVPTEWKSGDLVSSTRLNKLENGVKENSDAIVTNTADISTLKSQITEVESGFPQKSASGSIVTIEDGADNVPVVSLEAEINPVQDLHGFDNPWPAGGGKNLLDASTVFGGEPTIYTVNSDGSVTVLSADSRAWTSCPTLNLPAGSYIISKTPTTGTSDIRLSSEEYGTAHIFTSQVTFTLSEAGSVKIKLAYSGQSYPSTQKVQIESGSSPTSWVPYQNICPISGWTGARITVTGKNLFDPNRTVNSTYTSSVADALAHFKSAGEYATGYSNNGGPITQNSDYITTFTPIASGVEYSIKNADPSKNVARICFLDDDGNCISKNSSTWSTAKYTHTALPNEKWIMCGVGVANMATMQIVVGSTIPETVAGYIPSVGDNTVPVAFPDSAGTVYGGSLTLNQDGSADLTVDKALYTYDGSSDEDWRDNSPNGVYVPEAKLAGIDRSVIPIANYLTGVSPRTGGNLNHWQTAYNTTLTNLLVKGDGVVDASVEVWSAYLAENPLTVVFGLANPTTYHIENIDLVKTLYGLNNIWADTGDIDLTYRCDPATYTAEQIRIMLNAMVAPVEASTTASKAYSVNDFLIMDNVLYKVIANIANGGTITPNTNVSATTVGEQLTAILNS